jgi:single-stranded DNA-binding protein
MLTFQSVGNLVIDPKLINLKDDFKIVETRIAVTKTKDKTIYLDVKFKNNKAGEILLQHAKKGSGVAVWGELDEESWGDGENKRSKIVLVADGFRFTGGAKSDNKGEDAPKKVTPKSGPVQQGDQDLPF